MTKTNNAEAIKSAVLAKMTESEAAYPGRAWPTSYVWRPYATGYPGVYAVNKALKALEADGVIENAAVGGHDKRWRILTDERKAEYAAAALEWVAMTEAADAVMVKLDALGIEHERDYSTFTFTTEALAALLAKFAK